MKLYLSAMLTVFTIAFVFAQPDERLKGIEKEFDKILEVTKAPGFAVAVVEKDKLIWSKGFGYRDYENKIPVDANTLFAIGSTSKAFTCGVLGQLRQEEKLSFDDSPIKHIPELRFYNDNLNSNIIIEDLMSHRTGIPRHDTSWYLFPSQSKDSLALRIQYHEPFTGLRQKYYYNNFMFLTLGVIAERITRGKSWEDNIRERFFKPLGMKRSNLSIDEMEKSSNAALGYELKKDSIITKTDYYHIAGLSPAGSINSSVNDMAQWLITWINKGKYKGKQILPELFITEAISSHNIVSANLPGEENPDMHISNYGYGWLISSYKGHYRVQHGGAIDGFSATVSLYPSDTTAIVVLVNQDGSSLPYMVRNTVADRMLSTEKTDWVQYFLDIKEKNKKAKADNQKKEKPLAAKNSKPSHPLTDYTGKYSHPGYGRFSISLENDSLFAHSTLKKFYLQHEHYDVFDFFEVTDSGIDTTGDGPMRFNFTTNDGGEISSFKMKIEPGLDHPLEFKHEPNTIDIDPETLKIYSGDYEISGSTIKVFIKNGNTLYLFLQGQPEYELIPTGKHTFIPRILEGYKVEFVEADDGSISEMLLIQPDGTYQAIKK